MKENSILTGEQIKQRIEALEAELNELFTPEFFVLNDKIGILNKEIKSLQHQCPHQYENGRCVWCGSWEDMEAPI